MHLIAQSAPVGSHRVALEPLCRHFAVELTRRGIRVIVLSPGTVRTEAWDVLPDTEHRLAHVSAHSPRGRLTSLAEVAWSAQFLASEASAGLARHTLVVDGGGANPGCRLRPLRSYPRPEKRSPA